MDRTLSNVVRTRRENAGLSQERLADRVGITRQAIAAIEAGRQVPSTAIALAMARVLQLQVEDLFALPEPDAFSVEVNAGSAGARVAVGEVGGRWVAHRMASASRDAADGILVDGSLVQPFGQRSTLEGNVLVAGCAPLLSILSDHIDDRFDDVKLRWLSATSAQSLDMLAADTVHVAGIHLGDDTGRGNAEKVHERFGARSMRLVNLVRWRQGLVIAKGNPLGIRNPEDIVDTQARVAWRSPGAAAYALLVDALAGAERLPDGPVVDGHMDVAQAVRLGAADVGVAIESAALAFDLEFIPLSEERFDLVFRTDRMEGAPIRKIIDGIEQRAFRREVDAIGGYDASSTGHVVTVGE